MVERRFLERFKMAIRTKLKPEDRALNEVDLLTRDVSSGGVFLETTNPLPVGTRIKILMYLPYHTLRCVNFDNAKATVYGIIIRHQRGGMAVEFEKEPEFIATSFGKLTEVVNCSWYWLN